MSKFGKKINNATDVAEGVSHGVSALDAVKNLTGNDTSPAGYAQAVTNLVSITADLSQKLPKTAAGANIIAGATKILTDKPNDEIKISNTISLATDLSSTAAGLSAVPQLKFALYAISASLTAISWGISELEEYSEANEKEKARLEALFKEYQAKADKIWGNEAWNDKDNLALLYEISPAKTYENKENIVFKIRFNHTLDKELKMSYFTIDSTATNADYKSISDKNPKEFIVPKGVNEYDLNVPIIDDNEKENNENFLIAVNDVDYNGIYPIVLGYGTAKGEIIDDENSLNADFSNSDKNDNFTNLQNFRHSEFLQSKSKESQINSQILRHSKPLTCHSELSQESEESHKNLQTSHSQQTPQLQNTQTSRHSEFLQSKNEESQRNLQTSQNSQNSQNTPKWELSFTEKLLLKDFAYKLYGVKMPEIKQRIGADAATQHKISLFLGDICEHKRQIVRNFGEKTWQETFENFQKTNDLKVFEDAVKSPLSQQNANLQISNENANLKNSENNITNPQENGNDFKM